MYIILQNEEAQKVLRFNYKMGKLQPVQVDDRPLLAHLSDLSPRLEIITAWGFLAKKFCN